MSTGSAVYVLISKYKNFNFTTYSKASNFTLLLYGSRLNCIFIEFCYEMCSDFDVDYRMTFVGFAF